MGMLTYHELQEFLYVESCRIRINSSRTLAPNAVMGYGCWNQRQGVLQVHRAVAIGFGNRGREDS